MKKLDWSFIKECLKVRREQRKMKKANYKHCEPDWEIIRGKKWKKQIIDVKIDVSGKGIWYKINE